MCGFRAVPYINDATGNVQATRKPWAVAVMHMHTNRPMYLSLSDDTNRPNSTLSVAT